MAYSGFDQILVRPNSAEYDGIRAFQKRSNLRSVKSIFLCKEKIIILLSKEFFLSCWNRFYIPCIMISDIESFFKIFFLKNARTPNWPGRIRVFQKRNIPTYPNTPPRSLYNVEPMNLFAQTFKQFKFKFYDGQEWQVTRVQYFIFPLHIKNALHFSPNVAS